MTQLVPTKLLSSLIRSDSVSLLRIPFLRQDQLFSSKMLFICLLKYPYSCFSSHFCFPVCVILLILVLSVLFLAGVSCLCIFNVVFVSSYQWINIVLKAGESSSSFIYWHIICLCHLFDVRSYASSLVVLSSGQFVEVFPRPLHLWSRISYKKDTPGIYHFDEISLI